MPNLRRKRKWNKNYLNFLFRMAALILTHINVEFLAMVRE